MSMQHRNGVTDHSRRFFFIVFIVSPMVAPRSPECSTRPDAGGVLVSCVGSAVGAISRRRRLGERRKCDARRQH